MDFQVRPFQFLYSLRVQCEDKRETETEEGRGEGLQQREDKYWVCGGYRVLDTVYERENVEKQKKTRVLHEREYFFLQKFFLHIAVGVGGVVRADVNSDATDYNGVNNKHQTNNYVGRNVPRNETESFLENCFVVNPAPQPSWPVGIVDEWNASEDEWN